MQSVLVEIATREWDFFGRDLGDQNKYVDSAGNTVLQAVTNGQRNTTKERAQFYSDRICDYWLAIPKSEYSRLVKDYAPNTGKLDGKTSLAWSAAFISYCFKSSGAGSKFPYAAGHYKWMNRALKNGPSASIVAYRPGERVLKPGDLVAKPRQKGVTYGNARKVGWYLSHSDIVTHVDPDGGFAEIVGGNVGQSVSKQRINIDREGKMASDTGFMMHIQNNIKLPTHQINADPLTARVG